MMIKWKKISNINFLKSINTSRFKFGIVSCIWSLFISIGVFFFIEGGFQRLNPKNTGWISGDNLTAYVAQFFWVDTNWHFPLSSNPSYGNEFSSSLTYTGPSPLLSIIHKIFEFNALYQLFGLWVLANIFFQILFGVRVLRAINISRQLSLIGSVLFITPFFIFRIENHFWLISHFLILWAICILIKSRKNHKIIRKEVVTLIAISYFINSYLLGMVFIILIIAINELKENVRKKLLILSSIIITIALSMFINDGFSGQGNLQESIRIILSSTYGYHNFNLLSWLNPDTGLIAESNGLLNSSDAMTNLSSTHISLGMTKGSYEGYLYLGLGVITLLFLAVKSKKQQLVIKRSTMLIGSIVILYAITNRITIGTFEYRFHISVYLQWALSLFRASGRFMWIFAYLLIPYVIWKIFATIKHEKKKLIILLIGILIQICDLALPVANIFESERVRIFNNRVSGEVPNQLKNILKKGKRIEVWPVNDVILNDYAVLNYWAYKSGISTNLIYTSRENVPKRLRMQKEVYENLCRAEIGQQDIYVVNKKYIDEFGSKCKLEKLNKVIYQNQFYFYR